MGVYRMSVGVLFAGAGGPGANVWHIRTVDDDWAIDPSLDDAMSRIWQFYTSILSCYHPSTTLRLEDVVRIDTEVPEDTDYEPLGDLTGDGSGGELPPRLAICATWKTTARSRSGRGRTFIGPLTGSCLASDGTPNNTYTALVRESAQSLVADSMAGGEGWAVGVWSRKESLLRDFTGVSVRDGRWAALASRED